MADDLDLELEDEQENINKVELRIKKLSEKVKLTSEERDEKDKLLQEKESLLANTSKELEFFKGFSKVSAKYQGANEYQDKIWEKVKSGYDVEDATISILAKEGKYTPQAPKVERESAAGGSASTSMSDNEKTAQDMSQDERKAALLALEAKGEFHL